MSCNDGRNDDTIAQWRFFWPISSLQCYLVIIVTFLVLPQLAWNKKKGDTKKKHRVPGTTCNGKTKEGQVESSQADTMQWKSTINVCQPYF